MRRKQDKFKTIGNLVHAIFNGHARHKSHSEWEEFEFRQYGTEFQLCQRYYQTFNYRAYMYAPAGDSFFNTVPFPVAMRASPTFAQAGTWSAINVSTLGIFTTANGITFAVTPNSSGMTGYPSASTALATLSIEL
jgi:hypothetical protein